MTSCGKKKRFNKVHGLQRRRFPDIEETLIGSRLHLKIRRMGESERNMVWTIGRGKSDTYEGSV